jgi:hypothetical protein
MHYITKDKIMARAQADSNRDGVALCVLNLNRVGSPLYVIRAFDMRLLDHPSFVAMVEPNESAS